jgi:tRNA (cytidine56-2'-O)-methyltransferase
MYVTTRDASLEERVADVVARFGGDFRVTTGVSRRRLFREWAGGVVHLTMYGLPLDDVLKELPRDRLLVVVGGRKVPGAVFQEADFNVAVGNQPHSEVAALAVFLDRLLEGEGIRTAFEGPTRILPSARAKLVLGRDDGPRT